jgi:hypothetical protein
MSEEVSNQSAELAAPDQELTANPVSEVTTPEEKPAEQVKTFTQEELDAAIGKRLAREQRKWEREQAARLAEMQQTAQRQPTESISPDQFDSLEEYAQTLATRKAEELLYQKELQRQQREVLSAYHDREEDARNKYDDFEQVAYNPNLSITSAMAEAIQTSDLGPDVAYYLGSNPKEADRISRLSPYAQAKEIASEPVTKKVSSAPAPIAPITSKVTGTPAFDTTDPRSIKTMSASEWIEAERARQIRNAQAKNRY